MQQVFISHSSRDDNVAEEICEAIEIHGIRCWMAPRDIDPGVTWGGAIIDAIEQSKILLLILSSHSNMSQQVLREVERAVSKGVVILPVKIADVELSKTMEYFLSTSHWLDVYNSPPSYLETVVESVLKLLEQPTQIRKEIQEHPAKLKPRDKSGKRKPVLVAVAILLILLFIGSVWVIQGMKQNTKTPNPAATIEPDNNYNTVEPNKSNVQNTGKDNYLASESPPISVEHFKTDSTGAPVRYGRIGSNDTQTVKLNDLVRLTVDLNEPQHIMLLAFNPDGKVQLCYPEHPQDRSTKKQKMEFPSEKDLYFALTDGRGQQAFVILTSNELIPDFEKLGNQLESAGWDANDSGGVWKFDGTEVSQVFSGRTERGTLKRFTASHFKVVCDALTNMQPNTDIYGIAFQVQ